MLTHSVNGKAALGETPLFVAALHGRTEAVRLLLEAGADPLCITMDGQTILHAAAWSGSVAVGRLTLGAGVSINAVDAARPPFRTATPPPPAP